LFRKTQVPMVAGGKIDNLLGPNTSFKGTLKSDGNLRIEGLCQGHIETAGNVIIGPSAKVLADIVANTVQVWGAVRGNITAQGRLEILPTGRVWGDVRAASLLIDEGGVFRGQCRMDTDDVEPLLLNNNMELLLAHPSPPAIEDPAHDSKRTDPADV
jgi:cytoskeletal protein CcmA (bactofilin family)